MNGWVQDHLDVPCRSCDYVLVVTLPTVTCDRTGDLAGLGTDDASPKPVDLGFAGPNELRTCPGDPTQPVPEQEAPPAHPVGAREPGGDDAEPGQPAPEEDAAEPRRAKNASQRATSRRLRADQRPGRSSSRRRPRRPIR